MNPEEMSLGLHGILQRSTAHPSQLLRVSSFGKVAELEIEGQAT